MILSDERQSRFAHVIVDGLWGDDLADFTDDDAALRAAKRAVVQFVKQEGDIMERIRQKVLSLKRNIPEGSPEWDTMFRKYYEEEIKKSGQKI
jgi:hypothetical protein